jgi:predicted NBD/HSP70 family sugar kinase
MYALFDIGGTKTRVAVSNDLKSFEQPMIFDTPRQYEEGITAITDAIKEGSGGEQITAVAGGIRSPLNLEHSGIVHDDTLSDWQEKNLVHDIGERITAPVILENDADIAGLGEAHFGAGKGFPIVAYLTVSTGVGGARIVDGKIDAHSLGFEPGKQIIDSDQTLCPPCKSGTLEDYTSGTAVEARFGKKPYEISQSDPVWDELAQWLAYGLKNTIVYWSPDVIVLGGSMIVGDPRILLENIERHIKALLGGDRIPCPPIKDATLADVGGLYGAMVLLSQSLDSIGEL